MSEPLIIRGRYLDHTFIPDGDLPDAEGVAELIITPHSPTKSPQSVFDLFGKANCLRSAEDIAKQVQEQHEEWGDP
jgi:hypothetical protein